MIMRGVTSMRDIIIGSVVIILLFASLIFVLWWKEIEDIVEDWRRKKK